MTVAVALADGETVWMGADGRSTRDGDKTVHQPDKLWARLDGRMGMATAGSGRLGQELRHEWEPPAPPTEWELRTGDADHYVRAVAASIEEHFHASDRLWRIVADDDETHHLYGAVLLGLAGQTFVIGGDFTVSVPHPDRPFLSIGSGGPFADGSLHSTGRIHVDPAERVVLALSAAGANVTDIGPPYAHLTVPPA